MPYIKSATFALAASLILLPGTGQATVLVGADLGALSRDARVIAAGRVVAVEPRWTEGRRTIETLVTLDVDRYLKGSFGSTVRFVVPGGVMGRYRSIFVGAPEFAIDQRVIVFLGARGPSVPYVLGLSQGVYRIVPASSGGWVVTPPALLPTAGVSTPIVRGDVSRRPLALPDFEARVLALAGGGQ